MKSYKKYYLLRGLNGKKSFEVINLIPQSEDLSENRTNQLIAIKALKLHKSGGDFEIYY